MNRRGRGIAISYIYIILNTVIGFFMSAFVLRMLGKTDYGVYQTMTSFLTYLTLFEFGTGTIMTRNISLCKKDGTENEEIKKNISTVWTVTCILNFIICIGVFVFYMLIGTIYKKALTPDQIETGKIIFIISAVKLVFNFLVQTLNGVVLGFEKYSLGSIVSLTYLIVRSILVIALLIVKHSAIVLVTIDTVLTVCIFIFTICYCIIKLKARFTFRYFNYGIFRQILPLALAMFLQTIVNMANNNVDKFVIGIAMSPEAVSVYSVAMYIFSTFSALTTMPISMYMPQVARNMREGKEGAELTKTLVQPCRLVVIVGGLVLFGFIAVGRPFISVVYGKDYLEAWLIAIIIMVPMFVNMSNGIIVNVLDVLRKRHVRSICLGITAVGNILLTIWWIKYWGMIGAAAATAVFTVIGQIILMNIYYKKSIHIDVIYLFGQSFKGLLPAMLIACVCGGAASYFISNNYLSLIVGGVVFCGVLAVCMLGFGANKTEKAIFKSKISKLKSHIG